MSESVEDARRWTGWRGWAAVGAIAALLVGGIAWGVLANRPQGPSGGPDSSPTAQATEFETPVPGATAPVEKPDDAAEVPLDQAAPPVQGVVAEVTSLEATTAGNDVPGEPSGPAIQVTVRLTNDSDGSIDTTGSNVTLTYGGDDRLPAVGLAGDAAVIWPDSIPAGGHADAVFLFAVPPVPEGDIRVIVDILAAAPNVIFVGPRP